MGLAKGEVVKANATGYMVWFRKRGEIDGRFDVREFVCEFPETVLREARRLAPSDSEPVMIDRVVKTQVAFWNKWLGLVEKAKHGNDN